MNFFYFIAASILAAVATASPVVSHAASPVASHTSSSSSSSTSPWLTSESSCTTTIIHNVTCQTWHFAPGHTTQATLLVPCPNGCHLWVETETFYPTATTDPRYIAPNHSLTRTDTRYMCSPSPTPEDWWRHNAWPIARHISSHHRATEASDTTAATATLASAGSKISAGLAKETSKTAATQNEDNEVASSAIVKDKREPTEANAEELHRHGPAVARTMTTSSTKCKAARAATVTVSRWMNVPRREAIDPLAILNKVNATSPAASRMETLRHGHVSSHVAPSPTAISVHTEVRVHTAMVIKPPQTFTVVEGFAGSVIGVEMNGRTSVMTTVTESVSRTTLGLEPSPAVKLEERQESVTARVGAIIQSVGPDGVGVPISTIWDDDQYTPLAAVTFPPTL